MVRCKYIREAFQGEWFKGKVKEERVEMVWTGAENG